MTLDREGTKEARTRRPNNVSISPNPTFVKEYFVNFTKQKNASTRYKTACKVERVDLSGKDSELGEITSGLIVWKRDLLPPKMLLAVPLLITEREECDEVTKEGSRICRTQNPTTRETVKREQEGKLAGELAHKKVVLARDVTSDRKGKTNSRHEPIAHSTGDEEQTRRHLQNQKNCLEPKELPKRWRRYRSLKGTTSEPLSKHQFNLSRFKTTLLRKKRAYYESSPCKRKQINWELAQMCMCRYEMARTCMTIRNLKLYAWNGYFRSYALFGANDIYMMNDRVSMYTLIVFTNTWIPYRNELGFCKILRHVCECMCNKICNRTTRIRRRVKHGTCDMKCAHIVCNAWYALELKNHIDRKHFYFQVEIQPSPQIKLWGGRGLREDRRKTIAKLWKKL